MYSKEEAEGTRSGLLTRSATSSRFRTGFILLFRYSFRIHDQWACSWGTHPEEPSFDDATMPATSIRAAASRPPGPNRVDRELVLQLRKVQSRQPVACIRHQILVRPNNPALPKASSQSLMNVGSAHHIKDIWTLRPAFGLAAGWCDLHHDSRLTKFAACWPKRPMNFCHVYAGRTEKRK